MGEGHSQIGGQTWFIGLIILAPLILGNSFMVKEKVKYLIKLCEGVRKRITMTYVIML
jgi:hypothetical protein